MREPESRNSKNGGRERIRTSGRITPTPDFESGAFNHSATLPLESTRLLICANQTPQQAELKPCPDGRSAKRLLAKAFGVPARSSNEGAETVRFILSPCVSEHAASQGRLALP